MSLKSLRLGLLPSDPKILGFDTSGPHCAVALLERDFKIESVFEPMRKGQVENLFPILETLLKRKSVLWNELNAIAVGIGPGNFTGIRLSVSAARGLALNLGIPAIAISNFEILEGLGQKKNEDGQIKVLSLKGPGTSAYVQISNKKSDETTNLHINLENISLDIPLDLETKIIGV